MIYPNPRGWAGGPSGSRLSDEVSAGLLRRHRPCLQNGDEVYLLIHLKICIDTYYVLIAAALPLGASWLLERSSLEQSLAEGVRSPARGDQPGTMPLRPVLGSVLGHSKELQGQPSRTKGLASPRWLRTPGVCRGRLWARAVNRRDLEGLGVAGLSPGR